MESAKQLMQRLIESHNVARQAAIAAMDLSPRHIAETVLGRALDAIGTMPSIRAMDLQEALDAARINSGYISPALEEIRRIQYEQATTLDFDHHLQRLASGLGEISEHLREYTHADMNELITKAVSGIRDSFAGLSLALGQFANIPQGELFQRIELNQYSAIAESLAASLSSIRNIDDFGPPLRDAFEHAEELIENESALVGTEPKALTVFEKICLYYMLFELLSHLFQGYAAYVNLPNPDALPSVPANFNSRKLQAGERVFAISADTLNVRSGPSTTNQVVHTINRGALVSKSSQRGQWCRIRHRVGDDSYIQGWVRCKYIKDVNLMVGNLIIPFLDSLS